MSGYQDAPATKMLATQCVVCGRSLVDARSVAMGIGPECRHHIDGGIDEKIREYANKLIHDAALAAGRGEAFMLEPIAEELRRIGLPTIASKINDRFTTEEARKPKVVITASDDLLHITTPFRRGDKAAFLEAWRDIPGRRYYESANHVPTAQKAAVWALLRRFFPRKWAMGPKGLFRIQAAS